jgi:hypothetical protein
MQIYSTVVSENDVPCVFATSKVTEKFLIQEILFSCTCDHGKSLIKATCHLDQLNLCLCLLCFCMSNMLSVEYTLLNGVESFNYVILTTLMLKLLKLQGPQKPEHAI